MLPIRLEVKWLNDPATSLDSLDEALERFRAMRDQLPQRILVLDELIKTPDATLIEIYARLTNAELLAKPQNEPPTFLVAETENHYVN